MRPKYAIGNKVRIKARDLTGRVLDAKIIQYENMTGEIIELTNIAGFIVEPWSNIGGTGEYITVHHYTVRISSEITLFDVMEDSLEFTDE